jgi:heme oxygenase (mycobilin-producing)
VRAAFRNRPHEVDGVPGFLRMEVCSPRDAQNEFWLTTYWIDDQSFLAWRRSDAFKRAHARLPRGLKLARSFRLRFLEVVADRIWPARMWAARSGYRPTMLIRRYQRVQELTAEGGGLDHRGDLSPL